MNTTIVNSNGEEIPVEITASIIYEDEEEIATSASTPTCGKSRPWKKS
jgi:hypothetical protein